MPSSLGEVDAGNRSKINEQKNRISQTMNAMPHPISRSRAWPGAFLLLALLLLPARLPAATRTVTTLADSGAGSLRALIPQSAPGDTIDFVVSGTITLTSGELVIGQNLIIKGPGPANLTVSGNQASRVFHIVAGVVIISDLTIANGSVVGANGADGSHYPGPITPPQPGSPGLGGGIYNEDNLTLINCLVVGNRARGGNGGTG